MSVRNGRLWPLIAALDQIAAPAKVRAAYWIVTPGGEYCSSHGGGDWCHECGDAMVKHLRRRDRRRREDYHLDGGWRSEHDGPVICAHCCRRLDGSLTRYGAIEELDHFSRYGVRPANPYDAHDLREVLSALEYTDEQDVPLADEAADLAEALLWSAT